MTRNEFTARYVSVGIAAAYGEATFPEWGEKLARRVPDHMQEGIAYWVLFGRPTGRFLNALLCGDLFTAVRCADDKNSAAMYDWCMFLWNAAPSGCFGSKEKVRAWTGLMVEEEA